MNIHYEDASLMQRRFIKVLYFFVLIILAFTGFGQMPVFKRYYLADMPGLGWTADYYLTHYLHYLGAIFLVGLFSLLVADYLLIGRKTFRLSYSACIRIFLLFVIVLTGVFRVLKNFPEIVFSPGFNVFIDTAHFGFVIIYFLAALIFKGFKTKWVIYKNQGIS